MIKVTKTFREQLDWALRHAMMEHCAESSELSDSNRPHLVRFVKENATFNQLLNLVYNDGSETNLSTKILEKKAFAQILTFLGEKVGPTALETMMEEEEEDVDEVNEAIIEEMDLTSIDGKLALLRKVIETRQIPTYKSPFDHDEKTVQEFFSSAKKAYGQVKQEAKGHMGQTNNMAASVAASALYKKFYSAAVQSCKDAKNRKDCLRRQRVKAIQATINGLKQSMASCKNHKNPEGCRKRYQNQITKWERKLQTKQG